MTLQKEIFAPGMYEISNERYHAAAGVSRSVLSRFDELPALYHYEYLSGDYVREDKEAWTIGEAFHTMLQEPHLFNEKFFVYQKMNRTTKAGKANYAQAQMDKGPRTLITNVEMIEVEKMVASARESDTVTQILSDSAVFERSIFWVDSETGITCKCRPDILNRSICADLKTTKDVSAREFQGSAVQYDYFMQAGMIYEGMKAIGLEAFKRFVFICIDKKPPYFVGIYLLDDDALQFGIDKFYCVLRKFAECQAKNEWPGYGTQWLNVPKWAQQGVTQ